MERHIPVATLREIIELPVELVKDIDALVGEAKRGDFLVETAQKEVKRRKLLAFLANEEPAWRDEDHPDLADFGSAEWVRQLRSRPNARLARRDENLDPQ